MARLCIARFAVCDRPCCVDSGDCWEEKVRRAVAELRVLHPDIFVEAWRPEQMRREIEETARRGAVRYV